MPLLSVEQLSVAYRQPGGLVQAVEDVSFTVEAGEVLALVGESGSGKSSVALALTRLLPMPPATVSGRVIMDETDLMGASDEALRDIRGGKIAYVFQDPATSLNPVLTIGEQLVEPMVLHAKARLQEARAQAVEWLRRVGIPSPQERLRAYPHELSGGMQQRVCIAMALASAKPGVRSGEAGLAGHPSLLIADEPTTALDVTIQVQILRLLRDLQRALNLSVLLISHDLMVVERIAHRVGVMQRGRLVELGPVEQVLRRPVHPHTQELLRCRAMLSLPRAL